MEERELTCRHCGRRIAVPASNCPWCGKPIMVICATCKQYTDDQEPVCQHCGAPLVPDTLEEVRAVVGLQPDIAELVADRERARLVASGVIAQYLSGFFFDDGQRRTVLVDLFGAHPDPTREAAALLFAAVAYLVQEAYCGLEPTSDGKGLIWAEVRHWDGQVRSLEGGLARRAGLGMTIRQVIDQVVADEMDFRFEVVRSPRLRAPGMPAQSGVRDLSARSATTAVVLVGRQTELPDHQEAEACRETYRRLVDFVQADPDRARFVATEILEVLDWFRRYEEDPTLALLR
ncbi:MAG TPA: zinc ribbon domain-containing protein [Anaerolineales bacterium]|nr:zinc ribbon domain-containing protein [Anaerolineales bacterium]